jgi:hypothetical protein
MFHVIAAGNVNRPYLIFAQLVEIWAGPLCVQNGRADILHAGDGRRLWCQSVAVSEHNMDKTLNTL